MITLDIDPKSNPDIVCDVCKSLPTPTGFFDGVNCCWVLEYVKEPFVVIDEVHSALKVGGTLILAVPEAHPYHADPIDCWRFTKDGVLALVEKGFKVKTLVKLGEGNTTGWLLVGEKKLIQL